MKVGDKAPHFVGVDQYGNDFDVKDLIGKKAIVVYFYPKNETKVCTAQACSFRDNYETFKDLNCEVIGVSGDSVSSHQRFTENRNLPFVLLADGNKKIRKAFQVPRDLLGLLPGRYTYVINQEGIIISVFHDMSNAQNHIDEALKQLRNGSAQN